MQGVYSGAGKGMKWGGGGGGDCWEKGGKACGKRDVERGLQGGEEAVGNGMWERDWGKSDVG